MKTRKSTIVTATIKLLCLLPVVILVIAFLSSCAARKKTVKTQTVLEQKTKFPDQDEPFVVVEEMPMFPGGDSTLLAFLSQHTKYPESAKTSKIQGKVIVRFCVTSEGGVDRISVLKGVSPELDAEAVRVVGSLPAFKPGKQGGKPVPVWYMVPINFALDKSPSDTTTN
jgi:periplasmic protein TonB